jgi:hypothetical protein
LGSHGLYSVYEGPWRTQDNIQQHIYRPTKEVPNRPSGPVNYEREEDLFGLDDLFNHPAAKKNRKM